MDFLDRWLHYIDTEEVIPLFQKLEIDYRVPKLTDVAWSTFPPVVIAIARDQNFSQLRYIDSEKELLDILNLLLRNDEKSRLRLVYTHTLDFAAGNKLLLDQKHLATILLDFLVEAIYLVPVYFQSQIWKTHKGSLEDALNFAAPMLLNQLVLSANTLHGFVRQPFQLVFRELKQMSLQRFSELAELISISVRSSETAMDLLLDIMEPETSRLLVGRPVAVRQFVKSVIGVALNHIDEASNARKSAPGSFKLALDGYRDGYTQVKCQLRIDSPVGQTLRTGDHVRLTATQGPLNAPVQSPYSMDAIVLAAEPGSATFKCLPNPPPYIEECAWNLTFCGPFVTSKTMFDAITAFYTERESCCRLYASLVGLPTADQIKLPSIRLPLTADSTLNRSQNQALEAAMHQSLVFLWGPPGTGKTHTIVAILISMLSAMPKARFLVTAPTHNAVDNILRRFILEHGPDVSGAIPLRVSNAVSLYWLLWFFQSIESSAHSVISWERFHRTSEISHATRWLEQR